MATCYEICKLGWNMLENGFVFNSGIFSNCQLCSTEFCKGSEVLKVL